MAKFWVGGTGNWSDTAHWATSSGGAGGTAVPTSSDNVTFDSASNATAYTLTIDITANCLDLIIGNPTSGSITFAGFSQISIFGSLTVSSSVIFTASAINMSATTTGKTITTNGVSIAPSNGTINFNGVGGGWTLQDNFTGQVLRLNAGTLDTNGKTVSVPGQFSAASSTTKTLTLGASSVSTNNWNFSGTGTTLNAGTSTITCSSNGSTNHLGNGLTYNNFIFIGTNNRTDGFKIGGNTTFASLTANGNSSTNRILVRSDIVGTARTITSASNTFTNVDFMDITGAGAGSWNLSAITGGSGNCGGNSGITFTTSANQYWKHGVSAAYSWATPGNWFLATNGGGGAGRVPLPQDTAIFDSNSFSSTGRTVNQDYPRIGSVDWTGVTNSPTWGWNTISNGATDFTCFGSMTLASGMNPSLLWGYVNVTLGGRGSYTITTAGNNLTPTRLILAAPGGTYTQQDNFAGGSVGTTTMIFNPILGTWNANNHNFQSTVLDDTYQIDGTTHATETITMGSGNWTIAENDTKNTSAWTFKVSSTATVNAGTSTLIFSDSTANAKNIYGGGKTYNNLTLGGSGTGAFTVNDSGTTFSGTTLVSCSGAASVTLSGTTGIVYFGLDFTGFIGSWIGANSLLGIRGNFTLVSAMTLSYSGGYTFSATSGTQTIITAGKSMTGTTTFVSSGIKTLGDTFNGTGPLNLNPNSGGTFNTGNFNITCQALSISTPSTGTINLGSSIITITGSSSCFNSTAAGITLNPGTSTIKLTNSSSVIKSIFGGGLVYNNIWINTLGTGAAKFFDSSTWNDMKIDAGRTVQFVAGTTQTVTSLTATGTAVNNIFLQSSILGSAWNIVSSSPTITCDYLNLRDSHASGGATFQAGSHSTNVSGNTGWIFGSPPPPSSDGGFFALM